MQDILQSEKLRDVIGQGVVYGQKKLDEYLKDKYKREDEMLKRRLEGEQNVLTSNLRMREYGQRAELDRMRDELKTQHKLKQAEEMRRIDIGAVEKLKGLGYSFENARDFLKITRGGGLYEPSKGSGYFERPEMVRHQDVHHTITAKGGSSRGLQKALPIVKQAGGRRPVKIVGQRKKKSKKRK